MLDHVAMPVLFAILIGILAMISVGTLVVFRIAADKRGLKKVRVTPHTPKRHWDE